MGNELDSFAHGARTGPTHHCSRHPRGHTLALVPWEGEVGNLSLAVSRRSGEATAACDSTVFDLRNQSMGAENLSSRTG